MIFYTEIMTTIPDYARASEPGFARLLKGVVLGVGGGWGCGSVDWTGRGFGGRVGGG